jgi:hypothetical protein
MQRGLAKITRAKVKTIAPAGIADDSKGWLFRTSPRHNAHVMTEPPMDQKDGWRMSP